MTEKHITAVNRIKQNRQKPCKWNHLAFKCYGINVVQNGNRKLDKCWYAVSIIRRNRFCFVQQFVRVNLILRKTTATVIIFASLKNALYVIG